MELHKWKEWIFDPDQVINGTRTCVQVYKCTICGVLAPIPCGHRPDEFDQWSENECPGKPPKEAWQHPIKDVKREDVEKRDYPAKRNGHEAKKRRK